MAAGERDWVAAGETDGAGAGERGGAEVGERGGAGAGARGGAEAGARGGAEAVGTAVGAEVVGVSAVGRAQPAFASRGQTGSALRGLQACGKAWCAR